MIRAAAGAIAVDVRISPWLLVCTALLALFLALGKRRAELLVVGAERTPGGAVLEGYSLSLVDQLLAAVARRDRRRLHDATRSRRGIVPRALVVTVPFVVFGIVRYLQLLHRHELGEEPENVLLGDLPILLTVAAWAVTCGGDPARRAESSRRGPGTTTKLRRRARAAARSRPLAPRSIRSSRRSTPCQPRRDQVDEEREVVEARVPLGEQLLLEPLEPRRSRC